MMLAPHVNSSNVDSSSWAGAIMSPSTAGGGSSSSSLENVSSYYDDVIASTVTNSGGGGTSRTLDYDDLPMDMRFNDSHVIGISVYSCLMIISAIGNTTVLRLLLRRKSNSSRPRINWMLIHLAIADLLVTFLMMPMEIGWLVTVSWMAGDAMCRIMSFFRMFGLCLSSNILICISVDRYHAVKRPLSMLDVDKRGKWMLIIAWLGSFACSAPQSLVFHVEAHPDFPWYEQCVTFNTFPSLMQERIYAVFGMIVMYWIPFIVIIYTYTSIIVEMYKRSRSTTTGIRRSSLGFLGRARVRTLKMTIIIVLVFFVCWTPYYVMSLWYWIDHRTAKNVDQRIQKALFLFACTNSCMNPIVYGAFNIRKGNKDLSSSQRRMTCSSRGSGGSGGAQDQVSSCRIVTWPHRHHHHHNHHNSHHHQQHRRRDSSSTRSSGSGRRVRLVPAEITIMPSGRYETTTTITLALDDMNSRLIVTEKKNNNISIL